MTEQEAIKYLQITKNCAENGNVGELQKQMCDMAIFALEKQIPKKPTYEGDGYDPEGALIYDEWICPCCSKRYEVDYDEYDFCPNCGQAIDMNIEENKEGETDE